jgi:hypothetical protein
MPLTALPLGAVRGREFLRHQRPGSEELVPERFFLADGAAWSERESQHRHGRDTENATQIYCVPPRSLSSPHARKEGAWYIRLRMLIWQCLPADGIRLPYFATATLVRLGFSAALGQSVCPHNPSRCITPSQFISARWQSLALRDGGPCLVYCRQLGDDRTRYAQREFCRSWP